MIKITKFVSRNDEILTRCSRRRVLHLGCVGFTDCTTAQKKELAKQSLHAAISDSAECIGIDYDIDTIEELKKADIFKNIIYGDVQLLGELDSSIGVFDIVLAGDIIEHISNPGLMLDGIKPYLKSDGFLIVSTPNAFSAAAFIRYMFGKFREGNEHVMCFNIITLQQMLERHGYKIDEAMTCYQDAAKNQYGLGFRLFRKVLCQFPRFGGTLIYICRLK